MLQTCFKSHLRILKLFNSECTINPGRAYVSYISRRKQSKFFATPSKAVLIFSHITSVPGYAGTGPYDVLGLERNCSQQEIKDAFYALSKKYHPDIVGSDNKTTKMFVEIKEAYVLLRDEDKRREYDAANSPRKSQPRDNASFRGSARNHQKPDIMPPTSAARFYDPTREMELAGRRKLYAVGLFLFFSATVVGSNAYVTRSTSD